MIAMLETIKKALADAGVSVWAIEDIHTHSAELYFIRRGLDTRRMKDTQKYNVRVYRDFEKDGKPMRGMSSVSFVPTESPEAVAQGIRDAYFAASFVENPAYPLPGKQVHEPIPAKGSLADISAEDAALKMAEALFAADTDGRAFVNSAEIFASQVQIRLLTDCGTDVSYAKNTVSGEFVAQCKEPLDVELYQDFQYDQLDTEALTDKVRTTLKEAADRTAAEPCLATDTFDVLLTGDHVREILSYYVSRASARMVFPGYSTWKKDDQVQADAITGEALSLTLKATTPYSGEGIPMVDRPLLREGRLQTYHGDARFSAYLGVEPTGDYGSFICENGSVPMEEMQKAPCLCPVAFSDFQMDSFSGHFGGEIRLAYWFDGRETRIVTGGSINGSILDCGGNMVFSQEKYKSLSYEGPKAVLLRGVSVAGSE